VTKTAIETRALDHLSTLMRGSSDVAYNFEASVIKVAPLTMFPLSSGIASLSKPCSKEVSSPNGYAFAAPFDYN